MAIKNINKYLKNRFIIGSECMYQDANSKMDHVTYKATGVKITEYRSNLKLTLTSKVDVFIHDQVVTMVSTPSLINKIKGNRLTIKDSLTEFLTQITDQLCDCGLVVIVESKGEIRKAKIIKRLEDIIKEVECITTAWICTKGFWFLRPTD